MENLTALSYDLRKDTVDIIVAGKGGHIGGDMSVIDTLIALYFDQMNVSPECAYEACKYIGVTPDLYDPIEEEVKAYLRGE